MTRPLLCCPRRPWLRPRSGGIVQHAPGTRCRASARDHSPPPETEQFLPSREVACVAPQAVLSPNARQARGAPSPQVPHLAEKNARTSDKRRDPSPSRLPENQRKAAWATASKLRTCIDFPLKSSKGVSRRCRAGPRWRLIGAHRSLHPPGSGLEPRGNYRPTLMGELAAGTPSWTSTDFPHLGEELLLAPTPSLRADSFALRGIA